jgi:nucleoside-diphosphate-sugar epimerase
MAMASLLVTGSSGFLGNAIVSRLLARGHYVVGLDPAPPLTPQIRTIADDLSSSSRIEALLADEHISHVIHSGGISGAMVLPDRPDRLMAINVGGSCNLLQAAVSAKVGTFLYCSSASAYGPYEETQPIDSDFCAAPTDPYGCSKLAVDLMLRGLHGRVATNLCSLRFAGIYGPGRRTANVIDGVVDAAIAGRSIRLPRQGGYPYVYIDDAADAAVAACFSERRRDLIYNIAYPEQVALGDIVDAAAVGAHRVTLDVDESRSTDPRGALDISAARRDFDFNPAIDHREGVRRLIEAKRRTLS